MAYSAGNPAFFWYSFAAGRETAVISVTGIRLDSGYKKARKSVTYLSFYLYKINCCCVLTCSIFLHPCLIHSEAKTSNLGIAFCFFFWNRNFISLLLSFYFLVSSFLQKINQLSSVWLAPVDPEHGGCAADGGLEGDVPEAGGSGGRGSGQKITILKFLFLLLKIHTGTGTHLNKIKMLTKFC